MEVEPLLSDKESMTTTTSEIRPIPEWDDYFISRDGHVFSDKSGTRKELAQQVYHGYSYVGLCRAGKVHQKQVHRLLAITFLGDPCDSQIQTRHKNGIKSDNRVDNIEFGTAKENCGDRRDHGTWPEGEKNGRAILSDEQVLKIRYTETGSRESLAKKYRCSVRTIQKIQWNQSWAHLIDPNRKPVATARSPLRMRFTEAELRKIAFEPGSARSVGIAYGIGESSVLRLRSKHQKASATESE